MAILHREMHADFKMLKCEKKKKKQYASQNQRNIMGKREKIYNIKGGPMIIEK